MHHHPQAEPIGHQIPTSRSGLDLNRRRPAVHCSRYFETSPAIKLLRRAARRVFA